jgi:asparagine synthase (glutamine-hydrolysing)
MCGIAGFISDNPKYDGPSIVGKMLERMAWRGPDQAGLQQYGACTLGMVRLSIIDTADHEIPIRDASGRRRIVYNGEIYNTDEIKRGLRDQQPYRTRSDAEIALRSYIQKGIEAFSEFNGMYAFAIWDDIRKEVIIVRDKAGEKPLYYCYGKDYFAFASEMKCLLEIVKPEYNVEALSYLAFEFTCGRETLFKDIFCLEPGEFIRSSDGHFSVHSYWKIWDHLIQVSDDYKIVKAELTELLHDAVSLRFKNCAHDYGVLVSGGLDSALVACITKPDILFTCHYDLGKDFDELGYAKLLAKKIGRDLEIVEPIPDDFRRTEETIAYHMDTPCTWTSFSWWMLLEKVSQHVKVIMTGDGADEIFGGYHRYLLLYHDEQIYNMDAMAQYSYLVGRYYGSPVKRYSKLINRCENQYLEDVQNYVEGTVESYFSKMANDVVHSMGVVDFYTTMQVLLQMSDRTCMAFGVENRSPFLDHRLLQYAFSLESSFKIRNGVTKWILKDIAREFVPKEIVERIDKRGFSAPINRWFGEEHHGKYDRTFYRKRVFDIWRRTFIENGIPPNLSVLPTSRFSDSDIPAAQNHHVFPNLHHC